jgi:hypothetical protein
MAKQNKAQKETVERVMHEFKEGDLETGGGRKVKSRRQAVAIALSEAGASNQQSPAENKKRLATTKKREKKAGESKADLYAEAKKRNIPGRSKMDKAELTRALAR